MSPNFMSRATSLGVLAFIFGVLAVVCIIFARMQYDVTSAVGLSQWSWFFLGGAMLSLILAVANKRES